MIIETREIGLKPKSQRMYELEDGSEIKLDITTAAIEFMGDIGSTHIGHCSYL